jgi:hypothetical protein
MEIINMVDVDPEVFNNPDRGKSYLPFLDEVEAQAFEDRNAELEGRPSRQIKPRDRFGIYAEQSANGTLVYEDGDPVTIGDMLTDDIGAKLRKLVELETSDVAKTKKIAELNKTKKELTKELAEAKELLGE